MPLKRLSRRHFALTVGAATATAVAAQAQKKKDPGAEAQSSERQSSLPIEPCVRNPVFGDFPLPMSTEPAFRFQA